jgi:hypothetical protein
LAEGLIGCLFFSLGYFHLGELYVNAGRKEKALENLKKDRGFIIVANHAEVDHSGALPDPECSALPNHLCVAAADVYRVP